VLRASHLSISLQELERFDSCGDFFCGCGRIRIMKTLIKIIKWVPAIFIFCCSWYLSSQEHIDGMPSFWNADKVVHCLCFAGLSFWVTFACFGMCEKNSPKLKSKLFLLIPICIVSVYGIIDEIHQSFTPGRECSVLDWCADTIGASLGAFVFTFVCNSIQKLKNKTNFQK